MSKSDVYLIDRNTKAAAPEAAVLVAWLGLSPVAVAVAARNPLSESLIFV
ncbi:hypothetical protein ACFLXI_09775 [Chloroflexota bacterium]